MLEERLQSIKIWTQSNSRWTQQLTELRKQKNVFNSVSFAVTELKSGVVVAESHPQH